MNASRLRSLLAGLVLLVAAPLVMAASTVQKVELNTPTADSARLVLNLSAVPKRKIFTLSNPERIVIDLAGTRLKSGLKLPKAAGAVRSVRSGTQGNTLRLVVELTRKLDPVSSINGSQLIIDMGDVAKATAAVMPAPRCAGHAGACGACPG